MKLILIIDVDVHSVGGKSRQALGKSFVGMKSKDRHSRGQGRGLFDSSSWQRETSSYPEARLHQAKRLKKQQS